MDFWRAKKIIRWTLAEVLFGVRHGYWRTALHSVVSTVKHLFFGHPWNIQIEPVNYCNLACEFCSAPPSYLKRPRKEMSLGEFKEIISQVEGMTHFIWFFLAGEPFINREAIPMIKHASDHGLSVITSSNLMLLDRKKARELVESGLDQLIVSLDGVSRESYEKMRKGANFGRVMSNLNALLEAKKELGSPKPKIVLQMIVTKVNESETEKFKELGKKLGVDKCVLKTLGLPYWVYPEDYMDYLKENYFPSKGKKRYFDETFERKGKHCTFDRKSVILADGSVVMCCYDIQGDYCFGNVFKRPFSEIWGSERYRAARQKMKEMRFPLCRVCAAAGDV